MLFARVLFSVSMALTLGCGLAIAKAESGTAVKHPSPETVLAKDVRLRKTGAQLRAAIDAAYQEMQAAHKLKSAGNGRNSISDVVIRFIPIGMDFAEAEHILRYAGFAVGARQRSQFIPGRVEALAIMDFYKSLIAGKASIYISLQPKGIQDWSVVNNISAEITLQYI